jgi:hypothetical protein
MNATLDTQIVIEAKENSKVKDRRWQIHWRWEHPMLGAIVVLTAFLELLNLSINGYSNAYTTTSNTSGTADQRNGRVAGGSTSGQLYLCGS